LSAQERLASCDSKVVVAAAKEIVNRPDTFKEPFELFSSLRLSFNTERRTRPCSGSMRPNCVFDISSFSNRGIRTG